MEIYYALLKNNRVENIIVMDSIDDEAVALFAEVEGYDAFKTVTEKPAIHSLFDGKKFTAPDLDYLYEIGVSNENSAMVAERLAKSESN